MSRLGSVTLVLVLLILVHAGSSALHVSDKYLFGQNFPVILVGTVWLLCVFHPEQK